MPFGSDVQSQLVPVETNYDGQGSNWVASVLVGELQAGDGFFTPEQGAQIVVKCILGKLLWRQSGQQQCQGERKGHY